ncbi:hypothetical protein B5V88_11970 [Heyndrickxia sporothermodurans]|nr:hypothetical protein B5V88_11970 [Heyndrickxia sporothermodurans]PTY87094.1 hypothetical protein B5V90_11245 [Heyndrickxia sporothermodurans]
MGTYMNKFENLFRITKRCLCWKIVLVTWRKCKIAAKISTKALGFFLKLLLINGEVLQVYLGAKSSLIISGEIPLN